MYFTGYSAPDNFVVNKINFPSANTGYLVGFVQDFLNSEFFIILLFKGCDV